MPKVSIIIPFNNVEDYIEQCLDSVLNQTLKDIEVVLINDNSTDKSVEIVQKYIENDSRIKLLTFEERKGQGFARNRGIEIATGEYIGFVDSDDFAELDMFEKLYNAAKNANTDITMCQVREYDDINETYITSDYYSLEPLMYCGDKTFSAEDTKEQILDINVALWNKLYKRTYLIEIGEKFPEGYIYEDLPFFFGTYLPAKKINIVWGNLYSYRVNRKNSTMQQFNSKILDRLPMVSLTYEKMKKIQFLDSIKQKIQGWIINDIFHRYTLLKENYHKEYFFLMKKIFENLEIDNIEDAYWKRVYHFDGYLLVLNNSFENFNQKVFNEYLDIHKVENRILSQIISNEELDRRFGFVYGDFNKVYKYVEQTASSIHEEISKNYDYTNKLVDDLSNNLKQKTEEDVKAVSAQIDEKISKVYEEISKNYDYTNKLVDDLGNDLKQKAEEDVKAVSAQTDEKISKVYEEISKNYDYTNNIKQDLEEKSKSLYSDIKDVSYVLHDNFEQVTQKNNELNENYNKLQEKVTQQNSKIEEQISYMNKEIETQSTSIDKIVDSVNLKISNLKKEFEIEKQGYLETIESLRSEYKLLLKEQEIKHKQELIELQSQIKELEYNLREEMKSPIKKLIEKYKNKQEK